MSYDHNADWLAEVARLLGINPAAMSTYQLKFEIIETLYKRKEQEHGRTDHADRDTVVPEPVHSAPEGTGG